MIQSRRFDWPLLAIVLLGIGVRVAFASLPRVPRWDEAAYLAIGRNLLAGNGYRELLGPLDVHQPPLVALLAALGLALHLPLAWAVAAPSHVALGSLIVLPLYALGRRLFGHQAGLLAGLLGALHPALAVNPLYWGSMTEAPFLLAVLSGLYACYRCAEALAEPRPGAAVRWGLAMGAAFGLGYLARPEALVFLAVMLVYLGLKWLFHRPRRVLRLVAPAAAALAAAGMVALPNVLYLHHATGRWMLSGKAGIEMDIAWAFVNRSQAMHDKTSASLDSTGQEIMWLSPEAFDSSITDWIKADPARFATLVRTNVRDSWNALFHEDLLQPWLVGLMLLGIAAHPWTRSRLRGHVLLALAFAPLISLWLVFIEERFLVAYLAISLWWAAAGLAWWSQWAAGTLHSLARQASRPALWLARIAPPLLVALLLLWNGMRLAQVEQPKQPFIRQQAGQWLAANTAPDSRIMTRDTETPLIAGRAMVAFPNASWEEVLGYARAHEARYLVVDDWEIRNIRPQLMPLLEPVAVEPLPGLRLVQRLEGNGRVLWIYQFD